MAVAVQSGYTPCANGRVPFSTGHAYEETMQIDMTAEEIQLLREVLERAHNDLRGEVHKTEAAEWKKALKDRERLLTTLLARLG